jgi:hypothetical protein
VWRLGGREESQDKPADSPPTSGDGLAGGGRSRPADVAAVADPFAEAGPMSRERAKKGLRSRLEALRVAALEELLRRGIDAIDDETRALLEEMAAGPKGRQRALAQAVLMRADRHRRWLREIAEQAGATEFAEFYAELAATVDPATGPALVAAFTAIRERATHPELPPLAGIDDVIAALAEDPKRGADAMSAAFAQAAPQDEPAWLEVAAKVRPVPAGVVTKMAERVRDASADRLDAAEATFGFVLRNGIDLSQAPPELHAALASHLVRADDPLRGASMRALGRLKQVDPATIERIVRAARDGEQASYDALIALRGLGEAARPHVARLIALEPSLTTTGQFLLAQALLAIGGDGVGAYASRRLAGSNPEEHVAWMHGAAQLAKAPDAPLAMAQITGLARSEDERVSREAVAALGALAAAGVSDPAAPAPVDTLASALADPRPAQRLAAVRAVAALPSLPTQAAAALSRLVDDPDAAVRALAIDAIVNARRLGPDAKPLVPTAIQLLDRSGPSAPGADARVGLLRTIAAADPDAPESRARLRAALASASPEERMAGLYGLSRVAAPTAEEKKGVASAKTDELERVRALAAQVLAQPAWN